MIYGIKAFFALIAIVMVSAIVKFPMEKIDNRQFVAAIRARAAKGIK